MQHPHGQDPTLAYEDLTAAIARRDVDDVLARLSTGYGRHLRASREKRRFGALFELWCETFPRLREVIACFIDGDCAILETHVDCDGVCKEGRVYLVHDGDRWRIDSERCTDGRTRIPLARLSPCSSG
jgi:hypothetical protein